MSDDYRIMESAVEARAALVQVIEKAARELCVFDHSASALADREFGNKANVELLRQLLLRGRAQRIRIVLHSTNSIETELPRVLQLLRQFGQQIAIHRTTAAARDAQDAMVIADDTHIWRMPVASHRRSIIELNAPIAVRPFADRFEEIWESSELAVTDGVLGI